MININKIVVVPYRINNTRIEFLGLKRNQDHGGYWQLLTGNLEQDELPPEAARREIAEEIHIDKINNLIISEKIYHFTNWQNEEINEQLFLAEIPQTSKIILSAEHEEYNWFEYQNLLGLLKFDNNKNALTLAYEIILSA